MESDIAICNNCSDAVTGKFCSSCGNPVHVKRVDFHYVSHEIQHILHFEKGFLYTVKELLIRPGLNIKKFIDGSRIRLVKPIIFLTIASLIYTTIEHFFHIEEKHVTPNQIQSLATNQISEWVQNHYGYANLLMGLFIALWIKLFFKSYKLNTFEILILLCFVMGMGMLINSVFILAEGLSKISIFMVGNMIAIIYCCWAIGQFFDKAKPMSYVKSLIAYLLGMATFSILITIVGLSIDYFFKH